MPVKLNLFDLTFVFKETNSCEKRWMTSFVLKDEILDPETRDAGKYLSLGTTEFGQLLKMINEPPCRMPGMENFLLSRKPFLPLDRETDQRHTDGQTNRQRDGTLIG